jgi:hypothetical protein
MLENIRTDEKLPSDWKKRLAVKLPPKRDTTNFKN